MFVVVSFVLRYYACVMACFVFFVVCFCVWLFVLFVLVEGMLACLIVGLRASLLVLLVVRVV